ncbi:hypothetical protein [Shewanella mangrovisoli]|uniref:hypothetical protein n=1 Tax=Shewanella mangrovisoli TaxID=2864211 RepID=UPI001C661FF9|nr:hypothetical protein [Shewanella mangrovisoli]QYK09421.1 hypothetical protein K0H60_01595 [Shewanella mangrovisoli]
MSWTQQQVHPLAEQTRLICRYHRLSTRFELIAEHALAVSAGPGSNFNEHNLGYPPMGVWSELILRQPLYYWPRTIPFNIAQRDYRLHIWPLLMWRSRVICAQSGKVVIIECLDERKRRSIIRWCYFGIMNLLRIVS